MNDLPDLPKDAALSQTAGVAEGIRGTVESVGICGMATIAVDYTYYGPHILSKGDTFTLLNDKAPAAPSAPAEGVVSPGDAVFAFSAMLTSLPHVIPLGGAAWATPGADLAAAFNESNGLSVSRDFPDGLKFPEIEGKLLEVVKRASEEIKTAPEPLAQGDALACEECNGSGRVVVDRKVTHQLGTDSMSVEECCDRCGGIGTKLYASPQPAAEGTAAHERDALAEAIGKAAIKCGLLRPDIEGLTGPQLLMIVDDMATALNPPQPSASVGEMARELLAREYADDPVLAEKVRAGTSRNGDVPRALRAIESALTTAAGGSK